MAAVITSRSEIAAHREFASTIIRGADACVDEIYRMHGYGEFASLTLQVDRTGRARLVDLQVTSITDTMVLCRRQVEVAISTWNYRPFDRHGRAVPVQIVERALMLPAERWRTPRRPFPQIANLNSVLITLERAPGLFVCDNDRSAFYVLQIRGNGDVTIRERLYNAASGWLEVDGPMRRFRTSPETVERLVEQFRAADFFSLEEEYASGITDQPVQALTFETGTERAIVLDYSGETVGMPLVVRDLQAAVDAAAGLGPLRCGPEMTLR